MSVVKTGAGVDSPCVVQHCVCLKGFRAVMLENTTMYCQPYTPPNLAAIIPSVVLGAAVLSLALLAGALYWRHLHRLNAAAHAKMKGPPGALVRHDEHEAEEPDLHVSSMCIRHSTDG